MANTKSLLLNGTNNAFSMAEHADFDGSTWTAGAWIKTTATGSTRVVMSNHNRTSGGTPVRSGYYWAVLTDGVIRISMGNNTNDTAIVYNDTQAVNDGIWHFVVCTYDGSDMYVYIDGALSGSGSDGGATLGYGTTYPRIGCLFGEDTGVNGNFISGNIDGAFFVKNQVWDVTKIASYLNRDISTSETGLVAYYQMENNINDTSGSATVHNGTQIGTVAYSSDVPYGDIDNVQGYFLI